MIYYKLYPDIKCQNERYTIFNTDNLATIPPIIQLYKNWIGDNFLLLGEASIGKSTSMRVLEADLLYNGIPVVLIECGTITKQTNLRLLLSHVRENSVFLIDGLDELNSHYEKKLINFINSIVGKYKVIVSSRYNPAKKTPKEDSSFEKMKHELFKRFIVAELCPFSPEAITMIVGEYIDSESKCFGLLSNTMFLSIILSFFEGPKKGEISKFRFAEDEISFIQTYFDILFAEKEKSKKSDIYLRGIGNAIYKMSAQMPLTESLDIPDELNGIFRLVKFKSANFKITSNQLRYLDFALAKYLYSRVLEEYNIGLNSDMLNRIFQSKLNRRALVYLGNMFEKSLVGKDILAKLNLFPKTDTISYMNLVYVFLGYRKGVLDDMDVNNVFDIGKGFVKIALKHKFFLNNEHIKKINSIRLVDFSGLKTHECYECVFDMVIPDSVTKVKPRGFYPICNCIKNLTFGKALKNLGEQFLGYERENLQNICTHPQNSVFRVQDNCLIRKKSNSIVLCGKNPIIPENIARIEASALHSTSPIIIPRNISNIGDQDGYIGLTDSGERYFISWSTNDAEKLRFYNANSIQSVLNYEIDAHTICSNVEEILERKTAFKSYNYFDDAETFFETPWYLIKEYQKFLDLNPNNELLQTEKINNKHNIARCINFEDISKNIFSYYSVSDMDNKGSKFVIACISRKASTVYFSDDVFLMINGFPIVYMKIVDCNTTLIDAYRAFKKYCQSHESELTYTQICIITNGVDASIGRPDDFFEDFVPFEIDERKYLPTELNIESGLCVVGFLVEQLLTPSKLLAVIQSLCEKQQVRIVVQNAVQGCSQKFLENRLADEPRAKIYNTVPDIVDTKGLEEGFKTLFKMHCFTVGVVLLSIFILFFEMNRNAFIMLIIINLELYIVYALLAMIVFIVLYIGFSLGFWCLIGRCMMKYINRTMLQMWFEAQDYLFEKGYKTFIRY